MNWPSLLGVGNEADGSKIKGIFCPIFLYWCYKEVDISLLGWPLKLSIYYSWISNSKKLDILDGEGNSNPLLLAWTIPGTVEPGGLPSIGSHRVGHDWSELAAAADILERIWAFVRIQILTLTSPFKNGTDARKNVSCGYAKGPELLEHRTNVVKVSDKWRWKGRQWQDNIWHDENSGFYSEMREVSREFSVWKFWSTPWKQSLENG